MTKFLLGLLSGILLTIVAVVIISFSMIRMGEGRPRIEGDSTLILKLEGDIPEEAPVEMPVPFFGGTTPVTVRDIWSILRNAAADSRIKAVVLMPQDLGAGWGKVQEIRQNLAEFRKSGKPLVAFLRNPGTREYYLATAADKIYTTPEDYLDLKGLRAELVYLRKGLDKIGAEVEIQHIGKYKNAGDMFTETEMSPETREVMDSVLDSIWQHLLTTFGESRNRTPEQMKAILDQGPFTGSQALEKGLVDALRFEDQVYGELAERLKQDDLKKVSHRDYLRVPASSLEGDKRIALVVGDGAILRGSGGGGLAGDEGIVSGPFIRMLRQVGEDENLAGVILRVDSPGGDAIASDEILREMKLLSKKKALVVSMSDAAASGGYYVSMTGDPIVAYPGTFTGSIGIIYGKLNLRGLYDKLGIQKEILTRGRNAAIDTDYRPLSPAAKAKLQESLQEFYHTFVSKVAEARGRKYEEVEPLAQGRVWLGSQAKDIGLVDELGGLDKAIELVKRRAKIDADEKVRLVPYPPRRSWIEELLRGANVSVVESKLKSLFGALDYRLWMKDGFMRLAPYTITVN